MTSKQLIECFRDWRDSGDPLVLASVYDTEGSTYSKAGAQMLINGAGDFQGMLSGGCLEGDLAERARTVIENGTPQAVTYDLGQDDEELWGLGVGCDGLMRIFLSPLTSANDYQPFAAIAGVLAGDACEVLATVIESTSGALRPGASLVTHGDAIAWSDIPETERQALLEASCRSRESGTSACEQTAHGDGNAQLLFAVLRPPPRILVLGAGLDAQPLVRLISELGWRATVQDHRPAYIEKGDFSSAQEVLCLPVEQVAEKVDLGRFDGAVVMSHHLTTDRQYLQLLARSELRYIGLLGPPHRRLRLLDELGNSAASLDGRLRGPAGLDIGGSGPASIALSIVAQMHEELCRAATS